MLQFPSRVNCQFQIPTNFNFHKWEEEEEEEADNDVDDVELCSTEGRVRPSRCLPLWRRRRRRRSQEAAAKEEEENSFYQFESRACSTEEEREQSANAIPVEDASGQRAAVLQKAGAASSSL